MKITYAQNPLATIIELDEVEKQLLWYRIKVERLEDRLFDAHFHLQDDKYHDVEAAKRTVDPQFYCTDEKSPVEQQVDTLLDEYLHELQQSHVGDCTCVPMSCMKCHAEGLLGIHTTKGLNKHAAHNVEHAFDNVQTCEEAINWLQDTPINTDWPGSLEHLPRWKKEREDAINWLINYQSTQLKENV